MKSWYLIYTKPRQECIAQENLGQQGYSCYLPMIKRFARRRGKIYPVIEPLFPRYMFICLNNTTDDWSPIRSTVGVSTLVRFGQFPAVVPDELVDYLMSRDNEECVQVLQIRKYRKGDAIRISQGYLEGYEGIFIASTGLERVLVLMRVLGRQTEIGLDARFIERVA